MSHLKRLPRQWQQHGQSHDSGAAPEDKYAQDESMFNSFLCPSSALPQRPCQGLQGFLAPCPGQLAPCPFPSKESILVHATPIPPPSTQILLDPFPHTISSEDAHCDMCWLGSPRGPGDTARAGGKPWQRTQGARGRRMMGILPRPTPILQNDHGDTYLCLVSRHMAVTAAARLVPSYPVQSSRGRVCW